MITNSDQLRIIAFLKRFGCNSSECTTYIEAIKLGNTSIQDLARVLKRNRISVYYNVQQLIEKGLLFEIRKGKRRFISVANSEIFQNIIGQRYIELKSLETDVGYIAKLLNSIPVIKTEATVVKLYEETGGFKKMMEESLHAKTEIVVFSNTPVFLTMLGEDYYENYFARKAALGIYSRLILPPSIFANKLNVKKEQYKIDLRILQQNEESESEFYLWDNTLAIKSLTEGKSSCTVLENVGVAKFFRDNIFNSFWKEAKPINNLSSMDEATKLINREIIDQETSAYKTAIDQKVIADKEMVERRARAYNKATEYQAIIDKAEVDRKADADKSAL